MLAPPIRRPWLRGIALAIVVFFSIAAEGPQKCGPNPGNGGGGGGVGDGGGGGGPPPPDPCKNPDLDLDYCKACSDTGGTWKSPSSGNGYCACPSGSRCTFADDGSQTCTKGSPYDQCYTPQKNGVNSVDDECMACVNKHCPAHPVGGPDGNSSSCFDADCTGASPPDCKNTVTPAN